MRSLIKTFTKSLQVTKREKLLFMQNKTFFGESAADEYNERNVLWFKRVRDWSRVKTKSEKCFKCCFQRSPTLVRQLVQGVWLCANAVHKSSSEANKSNFLKEADQKIDAKKVQTILSEVPGYVSDDIK